MRIKLTPASLNVMLDHVGETSEVDIAGMKFTMKLEAVQMLDPTHPKYEVETCVALAHFVHA